MHIKPRSCATAAAAVQLRYTPALDTPPKSNDRPRIRIVFVAAQVGVTLGPCPPPRGPLFSRPLRKFFRPPVASAAGLATAVPYMSVIHHKRNLLMRFNWKNSSAHLSAGVANILVIGASRFETSNDAGLHPLTNVLTSKLKPLDRSLSASFDISPQHLICPLLRDARDVLYSNPGRF